MLVIIRVRIIRSRRLLPGEFVLDSEETKNVYLEDGQLRWRGRRLLQSGTKDTAKVDQAVFDQKTQTWKKIGGRRRRAGDEEEIEAEVSPADGNDPGYSGQIMNVLTSKKEPVVSSPSSPSYSVRLVRCAQCMLPRLRKWRGCIHISFSKAYIYIYIYIYIYVCMYTCMYVRTYVCTDMRTLISHVCTFYAFYAF